MTTFLEMQEEIITFRFNTQQRDFVKRWINQTYAKVWVIADWHFREAYNTNLYVHNDDPVPNMLINDLGRVKKNELFDEDGNALTFVPRDQFFPILRGDSTSRGVPTIYTVSNRQIYLYPTPDADYTFSFNYELRLSHRDVNGFPIAGPMSADDDEPIWEEEHHYLLIPGAMAIGLKEENDPTWQALQDEFDQGLQAMMHELLPPDTPVPRQYGVFSDY